MTHEDRLAALESPRRIYVLAGEASGDAHAAKVMRHAKALQPDLEVRGMGGDELQQLGVGLVEHVQNTSIMGFAEVLLKLRFIRGLIRRVKADILAFNPDRILLVDYPGFNLRIARWAKAQGIAVDMYISPQVWAWSGGGSSASPRTSTASTPSCLLSRRATVDWT